MKLITHLALGAALCLAMAAAQAQVAQHPCGSLRNAYGPFDYRIYKDRIEVQRVDEHHFTPLVENLIKPMFGKFGGDFDYTLRAVPNHHRALISMAKYSLKIKNIQPPGLDRTVDCFFDRAMRFAPDDLIVRMIYADFMLKQGKRLTEAVEMLDHVAEHADENPLTHFNAGLLYYDAKEYGKASQQAQRALDLGLTNTALKDKLVAAGKWVDPPAGPGPAASTASAAASAPETSARAGTDAPR